MNHDTSTLRAVAALVLATMLVAAAGVPGVAMGATSTEVSIAPNSQTVTVGQTTTFDVVVETTDGDVGASDVDLELTDPSVAEITAVSVAGSPGFVNTDVAADGSSAGFQAVYGNNPIAGASPTIATVTVEGVAEGSTGLSITDADLSDLPGNSYDVTGTNGATLTVEPVAVDPADFQVSNLQAPGSADAGESISVSATVTNDGGESGTQTVVYQFDGQTLDSEQVTLDAGQSQAVTFDVTVPGSASAGSYTHGVYSDDDSATAALSVAASSGGGGDGPATAVSLSPSEQTVGVGGTATFDVVVENADGGVGAIDLDVAIGDTATAEIVGIDSPATGFEDASVAGDGSSASIAAVGMDTADTGAVTVATVTVEGASVDSTTLSVSSAVLGTEDGVETYDVTGTSDATLSVVPAEFLVSNLDGPDSVVRGESLTVTADVTNDGSLETTKTVSLRFDLNGDGTLAPGETVASAPVTLGAGVTDSVPLSAAIPDSLAPGEYDYGVFTVDDEATGTVAVTLALIDDSYAGPPQDLDGDGVYEDVNGDGELTASDVQALFVNRDSGVVTGDPLLFDYNGDGQFNVVDVQNLFAQTSD
ncbi:CARDB domain-containing protein [Halomarina salina]|uniref:CARDB domain-containing protein n=1 Tax=Halomarina salina TaxID=1872699 RepID=A0ABD5RIT8_9EURY|nr:CARDB domain-containing protein [Halomarina salina]